MSINLEILRKYIRELIKKEIEEASVTGNIDGGTGPPKTPRAFSKKKTKNKTGHGGGHIDPAVFDYTAVNEGKYHDWRNDEALTAKQKIGMSMREVRDGLNELDKLVKMTVRLKNELGVNSDDYWKRTHSAMKKVSERLVKLSNKVGQLY